MGACTLTVGDIIVRVQSVCVGVRVCVCFGCVSLGGCMCVGV